MSTKQDATAPPNGRTSAQVGAWHASPLRAVSFGDPAVTVDRRDDGTVYLRPRVALGDYSRRLTDRLHYWAGTAPNRVFMAERDARGGWRTITYGDLLASARRIASALLARDLSADRHSLRQFARSRAGFVRRALCGHSVLSGIAGLFADFQGFRQTRLCHEVADTGPRIRGRCRPIRRRAPCQCSARCRNGRLARCNAGSRTDDARPAARHAGTSGPRCGPRRDRPRHHRQIPADFGLDRQSEGGHQY